LNNNGEVAALNPSEQVEQASKPINLMAMLTAEMQKNKAEREGPRIKSLNEIGSSDDDSRDM